VRKKRSYFEECCFQAEDLPRGNHGYYDRIYNLGDIIWIIDNQGREGFKASVYDVVNLDISTLQIAIAYLNGLLTLGFYSLRDVQLSMR
jgi:hypothetical protein